MEDGAWRWLFAIHGPMLIQELTEQRFLLLRCCNVDEIFSEERVTALLVKSIGETGYQGNVDAHRQLAQSVKITSINSFTRAALAPGVSVSGMIKSIMATTVAF